MKHIFIKFIFCVTMLLLSVTLWAQDIIVTTDAQKIESKILEVSKSEIKYKELDNLEGPTFVLETKDINSIIYANGKVVIYNQKASEPQSEPLQPPTKDESMAEIKLLSSQTISAQITDMKSDHVSYILDGKSYTLSASQIEKVTFLQNGQVREYNGIDSNRTSTTTSTQDNKASKSGRIYRDNGNYIYNDTYIAAKEVARILERENTVAYNEWQKAEGMLIGGSICAGIGGGLVIGGLVSLIGKNYFPCLIMECTALVPLGVGLGLTLGASTHYNKAIDIYNSKYDHAAMQLKWRVAPNEIGLAFAF